MFRIRRVYDDITPANKNAIAEVQKILHTQFPDILQKTVDKLPDQLRNPLKYRFRSIVFIAEGTKEKIDGFALLNYAPFLKFCYLDYLSAAKGKMGGGIGGALYERIREEALDLNTIGLFFECLPDDPKLSRNVEIRTQNRARLRFYERYGARPIVNTAYETPVKPGEDNPSYLVYDNLGEGTELPLDTARKIVRAILERKYHGICSPEYVDMVVNSFQDDPVRLRNPRYVKELPVPVKHKMRADKRIRLVINDRHAIHHVEEIGYLESPVRIESILNELDNTDLFEKVAPKHYSEKHILAIHKSGFVDYLRRVSATLKPGESVYPYVFPIRNQTRPPKALPIRAGYYCIDTFTPINGNAYLAAKRAVDCALTAARTLLEGYGLAYALVRPPGHHAETNSFGGFCYFNSTAAAAEYLSKYGKVTILDIDYHHGNGQQEIFYERSDVLTISIHGHPGFAFPYFTGFIGEKGRGAGKGYNINIPLQESVDGEYYQRVLRGALKHIKRFAPSFLIIALGLDTANGDPTGTWSLVAKDFENIGEMLGALRFSTLVVQEGGYDTRVLGINARQFLTGLWTGYYSP